MPNIKPVSDLRNYTDVIRDVDYGCPVYLTKNGRGRYVVIDMREYEKKEVQVDIMVLRASYPAVFPMNLIVFVLA